LGEPRELIWGGEAVAVTHAGRANPESAVIAEAYGKGLAKLTASAVDDEQQCERRSDEGLLICFCNWYALRGVIAAATAYIGSRQFLPSPFPKKKHPPPPPTLFLT